MRTTLLALALVISGMSGPLQAAKHRASTSHRIRKGETAVRIARDNGLNLAQLASLNPKVNLSKLSAGMTIKVGGKRPEAPMVSGPLRIKTHRVANPVTPLPGTPALGPASLVHLERILPAEVRLVPTEVAEDRTASATPALATLRSVLPETPESDELLAPPLSGPLGFEPANPNHLALLWPVETRTVSSGWGPRMRSRVIRVKAKKRKVRYRGSHKGVDLSAPIGTDVFAAMDGKVVACGRHKQYGNYVMLDHGNGVLTVYAHHNRNFVSDGQVVLRGQKIAEVGRTGNATGPHLHFELRVAGSVRNPLPMMNDEEEISAELLAKNLAAVPTFPSR